MALCLVLSSAAIAQPTNAGREFIEAVRIGNGGAMLKLISENPKGIVNTRGWDGQTPLVLAIAAHNRDFTGFLLNNEADPNLAGAKGEMPIVAAGRNGFDDAIGWLLGLGAKVDATNRAGETALIVAVQGHHVDAVTVLLAAGADPDRADAVAGYSARDYAKRDSRARDLLKLIEAKKPKPAK
ncbi:MAG: ankyrin repeat domain-containing protein [Sphingomicrobium sp.]